MLRFVGRVFAVIGFSLFFGCLWLLVMGVLVFFAVRSEAQVVGDDVIQSIVESVEAAPIDAEKLRERLDILAGEYDLPEGLADLGLDALNNSSVRELLNAGADDLPEGLSADSVRYESGVVVFASFSIPDNSLKAILHDAGEAGVSVVFNGFVNNSVLDTEAAIKEMYSFESQSHGFLIDPTLFERFDIEAVPVVVAITGDVSVCETPGCRDDEMPDHDLVRGNVPLRYALEIIAKGDGPGAGPALAALERLE